MKARLIKSVRVLLGLVLIASLIMNYMSYRRVKHEEQYVRLLYNQFIFNTDMAAGSLGKVSRGPANFERASVDIAAAANDLLALDQYESLVPNSHSGKPSTPYVDQMAIFLSYISLVFVKQNPDYQTSNGLITISQSSAKTIVFNIDDILMSNMRDSNIPTDKVSTVFDQIYNLIPKDFRSQNMLDSFYH